MSESSTQRMSTAVRALLLSPLILLIVSATRLLLIANYDTTSALSIAAAGGVVGTLLGSVLPLLPPYLPLVVLWALLWRRWGILVVTTVVTALISPAYATFTSAATATYNYIGTFVSQLIESRYASVWYQTPRILIVTVLGIVLAIMYAVRANTTTPLEALLQFVGRLLYGLILAAAAVVLVTFMQNAYKVPFDLDNLSQVLRQPWLPAEEITLADGSKRVAYAISPGDTWFTILEEDSRSIRYLRGSDVSTRRVCDVRPSQPSPPFLQLRGSTVTTAPVCSGAKS